MARLQYLSNTTNFGIFGITFGAKTSEYSIFLNLIAMIEQIYVIVEL